jgi:YHS domain-containing protein
VSIYLEREKMKTRCKRLFGAVLAVVILASAVILFYGCKKTDSEHATATATATVEVNQPMTGEQTICPVMGDAINKNIYTEYKGKKVYFCTPMCKAEFEKNPEKYIGKLPQFAK